MLELLRAIETGGSDLIYVPLYLHIYELLAAFQEQGLDFVLSISDAE
jgi:hypothetical protein